MTDPNPTAAEQTATSDNLTLDSLDISILGGQEPADEETQESESEEVEETEEETEQSEDAEETDESEDQEDGEESEGGLDIGSLTDEQVSAMLNDKRFKSGMLKRISQLTARAKSAEEALAKAKDASPPAKVESVENNPFSGLKTTDEIRSKRTELEGTIETIDTLLDENDDLSNDDVINYQGAEFTKRQLKTAHRNARKALDKFLPAQEQAIREDSEVQALGEQINAMVDHRFAEQMADEEFSQRHAGILEDPEIKKAMKASPKVAAQLSWIAAHYLRSLMLDEQSQQKKPKAGKVQTTGKQPTKVKPPTAPGGAGAPSSKPRTDAQKLRDASIRLEQSGRSEDLATLMSML